MTDCEWQLKTNHKTYLLVGLRANIFCKHFYFIDKLSVKSLFLVCNLKIFRLMVASDAH